MRRSLQEAKRSPFDDWPRKVSERDAKRWLDDIKWDDTVSEYSKYGDAVVDGESFEVGFSVDEDFEQNLRFSTEENTGEVFMWYIREGDQFVKV